MKNEAPFPHISTESLACSTMLPGLKLSTELLQLHQAVPGTQQTCLSAVTVPQMFPLP